MGQNDEVSGVRCHILRLLLLIGAAQLADDCAGISGRLRDTVCVDTLAMVLACG